MFSHVVLGADDLTASKQFYDAVLGTLGIAPSIALSEDRIYYNGSGGKLMITKPIDGGPASCANGGTIGFNAKSRDETDAWHAAGLANGGTTCEDPPGIRDGAMGKMYLAYLRDPAGNKLCAFHPMGG